MPKIRNGAKALVVGNVVIRQTEGRFALYREAK